MRISASKKGEIFEMVLSLEFHSRETAFLRARGIYVDGRYASRISSKFRPCAWNENGARGPVGYQPTISMRRAVSRFYNLIFMNSSESYKINQSYFFNFDENLCQHENERFTPHLNCNCSLKPLV